MVKHLSERVQEQVQEQVQVQIQVHHSTFAVPNIAAVTQSLKQLPQVQLSPLGAIETHPKTALSDQLWSYVLVELD